MYKRQVSGTLSDLDLLEAARNGDSRACEQVLEENNGLIWSVVRRYYGRGVEPDDLYQLGCLGFLKAVRGFDQSYGCLLYTSMPRCRKQRPWRCGSTERPGISAPSGSGSTPCCPPT